MRLNLFACFNYSLYFLKIDVFAVGKFSTVFLMSACRMDNDCIFLGLEYASDAPCGSDDTARKANEKVEEQKQEEQCFEHSAEENRHTKLAKPNHFAAACLTFGCKLRIFAHLFLIKICCKAFYYFSEVSADRNCC